MTASKLRAGIAALAASVFAAGCSSAPVASHVDSGYHGKLADDTLVEASTTVLETTDRVVIAIDLAQQHVVRAAERGGLHLIAASGGVQSC